MEKFNAELLKKQAALASLKYVKNGQSIGLGTGSTVKYVLEELGERLKNGSFTGIRGIATSGKTEEIARDHGIPLVTFEDVSLLDVYIDGADEVDDNLDMIKGGGAALIREKIVAQNSKFRVIVVDCTKLSQKIGERWPVPIEVFPMAIGTEMEFLKSLDAVVQLRLDNEGRVLLTDNGNNILDANFGELGDPRRLSMVLDGRAGIAGHGIFHGLADVLVVGSVVGVTEIKKGEKPKFESLRNATRLM
ncbi:ribose-5-phosphate isomerase RpiA [Ignavibacteriales bacterium]